MLLVWLIFILLCRLLKYFIFGSLRLRTFNGNLKSSGEIEELNIEFTRFLHRVFLVAQFCVCRKISFYKRQCTCVCACVRACISKTGSRYHTTLWIERIECKVLFYAYWCKKKSGKTRIFKQKFHAKVAVACHQPLCHQSLVPSRVAAGGLDCHGTTCCQDKVFFYSLPFCKASRILCRGLRFWCGGSFFSFFRRILLWVFSAIDLALGLKGLVQFRVTSWTAR